ncbi:MAG: (Fe-S)-binding protein [Thermodesulfobacteriota bacterium]
MAGPCPLPPRTAPASRPLGRPADHLDLDLPEQPPADWPNRFLAAFGRRLERYRSFKLCLDLCVGCGACAEACPLYQTTSDPMVSPAAMIALARRVYARFFTAAGRIGSALSRRALLTEEFLNHLFDRFHQCLTCRRCALFCPLGLDPSEVALAGREILAETGLTASGLSGPAAAQVRTGNPFGFTAEDLLQACADLEQRIFQETGLAVRLPVDETRAEVMLLVPAADIFTNPEVMITYAKTLHAAGIRWTISTRAAEADNPGYLLGYRHMKRLGRGIVEAAQDLEPRGLVWGEAGLGWRVARSFLDTLTGPLSGLGFLGTGRPRHITELTADLIRRGAFAGKLDPEVNGRRLFTYHDPCQAARGAGLFDPPREVLRSAVLEFREMRPDAVREMTLCCGGGGGRNGLGPEYWSAGRPRAEAFRDSGAQALATICHVCRMVLPAVLKAHIEREAPVFSVMELFGRALTPYLTGLTLKDEPAII